MASVDMVKTVGVSFKNSGKKYHFDPGGLDLKVGDLVIVETENGQACGQVSGKTQQVSLDYLKKPLKRVLRHVTEEDRDTLRKNRTLEGKATEIASTRIEARRLQMKLVEVEYLFDRSRVIFFFTADGRVDFRELVKDLAAQLRTRIEMRQIGVRDEAKMLGGYGPCGKEFCCKAFLQDFEPVSIKMAKHQNLSLNPSKISGVCGRLMCCLSYENSLYENFRKGLPKPGKQIITPEGPCRVRSHNTLKSSITIQAKNGKLVEIVEPDLTRLRQGLPLERLPGMSEEPQPLPPEPEAPSRDTGPRQKSTPPSAAKPEAAVEVQEEKGGLLSKIKKFAGVDKESGEGKKQRRPRRRRRRRPRKKSSGTSTDKNSTK
jgi:cell fate regulator YaaT (PSP1 superfamily)